MRVTTDSITYLTGDNLTHKSVQAFKTFIEGEVRAGIMVDLKTLVTI
jgi:hypothetical protein